MNTVPPPGRLAMSTAPLALEVGAQEIAQLPLVVDDEHREAHPGLETSRRGARSTALARVDTRHHPVHLVVGPGHGRKLVLIELTPICPILRPIAAGSSERIIDVLTAP